MDVVIAIDAEGLKDEAAFVTHLTSEGFEEVPDEEGMVFMGVSQTPVMHTRAYIFEVVGKALELSPAVFCNLVCLIGENPMESYRFNGQTSTFEEA
ncbi:MAG: hypothetical protein IBX45_08925 [Campylobacterales bacterium]|nr:hypothetical protein [Campylobacterales bacterium]